MWNVAFKRRPELCAALGITTETEAIYVATGLEDDLYANIIGKARFEIMEADRQALGKHRIQKEPMRWDYALLFMWEGMPQRFVFGWDPIIHGM